MVHLWKVKSHIGIVGNEEADRAAGSVAKGDTPPRETRTFSHPSNERNNMVWPHTETLAESSSGAEQHTRLVPLANMSETLAQIALTTGELGSSNQESIYFRSWEAACPGMNHEYSHLFINDPKLPQQTKRLPLQARYGQVPTQKLLS